MKTNMMKMGLLAAMVMGGINLAHAVNTVQVEGSVANVSCAVNVDQPTITISNVKADVLSGAPANKIVPATSKQVTVTLSACTGASDTMSIPKIRLTATGGGNGLAAGIFNTEQNPTFGIGVEDPNAEGTLLTQNSTIVQGDNTSDGTSLDGKQQVYNIGLVTSAPSSVQAGIARSVLTFDYLYN